MFVVCSSLAIEIKKSKHMYFKVNHIVKWTDIIQVREKEWIRHQLCETDDHHHHRHIVQKVFCCAPR